MGRSGCPAGSHIVKKGAEYRDVPRGTLLDRSVPRATPAIRAGTPTVPGKGLSDAGRMGTNREGLVLDVRIRARLRMILQCAARHIEERDRARWAWFVVIPSIEIG